MQRIPQFYIFIQHNNILTSDTIPQMSTKSGEIYYMPYRALVMLTLSLSFLLVVIAGCGGGDGASRAGSQSANAQILRLQQELSATRDSLELANSLLRSMRGRLAEPGDSILRRYALEMAFQGRSREAAALIGIIDGRTRNLNFTERRGSVVLTFGLLIAVLMGFSYVGLRAFRRLAAVEGSLAYNRAIAVLAGLLIYFVFSMAGLSIPVLFLNSIAIGRPLYAITMNLLALFTGALSTMFIGRMLMAEGERTILLGIILGVFTCSFFLDMLFKALFSAFEMKVLLPNTMFVIGLVLVYLFGREPQGESTRYNRADQEIDYDRRY